MTTFSNLSTRRAVRIVGGLAALAGALIASAGVASAATIIVTTGLDQYGTGMPGECSLREAIQSANTG
jgi:CSLREA domain-containing protein